MTTLLFNNLLLRKFITMYHRRADFQIVDLIQIESVLCFLNFIPNDSFTDLK